MKITVEVSDEFLEDVARDAVRKSLRPSDNTWSSDKGGAGYQTITTQVQTFLKAQDYSEQIAKAVTAQLPEVLHQATSEYLKAAIKGELRKLRESGELRDLIKEVV